MSESASDFEVDFTGIRTEQRFFLWGILSVLAMAVEVSVVALMPALDNTPVSWALYALSWVCIGVATIYAAKLEGHV